MATADVRRRLVSGLTLQRLGPAQPAGLYLTSLPVPPRVSPTLALGRRATTAIPLGQWPGAPAGSPRRLLLAADGGPKPAPEKLKVSRRGPAPAGAPPAAEAFRFAESPEKFFYWERHSLRLTWGGHTLEIAMGLRTKGAVHWWEACRLVVLDETPACRTVEMGGCIPLELFTLQDLKDCPGYRNRFLHHHNWLNGHVYARLHANGVCEVFAHHVNSKFFDDGLPLMNAVPVIGFRVDGVAVDAAPADLAGPWDGSRTGFALGPVKFDVPEVARLATPQQPGSVAAADGFVVWQPYLGMELFGGICPRDKTGDPYIFKAEQQIIPRGMARTLRFTLSLNPDRPAAVQRYLAPAWWFGVCEEFSPAPLLPVHNDYDAALGRMRRWLKRFIRRGGFEDGSVPRGASGTEVPFPEPGWEGDVPYGQFQAAWHSGDADEYHDAMRSAWYVTDVATEHAAKQVRMHGYPPNGFSVPMNRVLAHVGAWLECGDPFPLNAAEAIIEQSYRTHKNSWPRMAVGRDACFIRGAMLLWRFTAQAYYQRIARDSIRDVGASQRACGSFGDQGGGSGLHMWAAYVTKPWMGLMAVGGVLDYLELHPDDEEALGIVKRFADWLLRERYDHDGVMGWGYQHDYHEGREFINFIGATPAILPGNHLWHVEYLARLMMFCSLHFRDPAYFAAWEESYRGSYKDEGAGDHSCAQGFQFLPWLQARLWRAELTADGSVAARPVWLGARTPRSGTLVTPAGAVALSWETPDGAAPRPAAAAPATGTPAITLSPEVFTQS